MAIRRKEDDRRQTPRRREDLRRTAKRDPWLILIVFVMLATLGILGSLISG